MPTKIHHIRLRGPWQIQEQYAVEQNGVPSQTWTFGSLAQWQQIVSRFENTTAPRLELSRRFHWTFPQPPPARIELSLVHCRCAADVCLNESMVGQVPNDEVDFRVDVDSMIQPDNRLTIRLSEHDPHQLPLADVVLLIHP